MRILFNAAGNIKGGAAQRASEFLRRLAQAPRGHTWRLAISPAQYDAVGDMGQAVDPSVVDRFEIRPGQSRASRSRLREIAREFRADCVFTLAGPTYVSFPCKHLMGVADGWVTHATLRAYRTLAFPYEWIHMAASCAYKAAWLRTADAYIAQTRSARRSMSRRLCIPVERIAVVPNTCAQQYRSSERVKRDYQERPLKILCFAAPYRNKRLELIPFVAQQMSKQQPELRFQFLVTLPLDCDEAHRIQRSAEDLGVTSLIENRGPVPFHAGPQLYRECHACFLPTVLETFSANYPEAMAMEVPMVTTDLGFARDVCGSAALYIEPDNVLDAAYKLLRLLQDAHLREQLILAGRQVLARLPTAEKQYDLQVDLIEALVEDRFAESVGALEKLY